jgi:hypothetical protein
MNSFPDPKDRKEFAKQQSGRAPDHPPEPPSPRPATGTYSSAGPFHEREPTTYSQLADRENDVGERPSQAVPRIASGPWSDGHLVPPEPPLGYSIDDVGPDSGGGASPKPRDK